MNVSYAYQVVKHLSHEVHEDSIVVPLPDEFFQQSVLPLLHQVGHDLLLDVVLQRLLEVVVQVLRLVVLVTQLQNHSTLS